MISLFSMTVLKLSLIGALIVGLSHPQCPEIISQCKCFVIPTSENPGDLRILCSGLHAHAQLLLVASTLYGHRLEYLLFNDSKLRHWPSDVFNGIAIKGLMLHNSEMTSFSGGECSEGFADSVERLTSVNTHFIEKGKWTFSISCMRSLKLLLISENKIPRLIPPISSALPRGLKELHLKRCGIEEIEDEFFSPLQNLKSLGLEQNKIQKLPDKFQSLTLLQQLDLTKNQIIQLPGNIMNFFPNLKNLYLSSNKITSLQSSWSDIFRKSDELVLTNNPLVCDDDMKWIVKHRKPKKLDGVCVEPEKVKNKHLNELTSTDFDEENHP